VTEDDKANHCFFVPQTGYRFLLRNWMQIVCSCTVINFFFC